MINALGFDIGGANTKIALIQSENGIVSNVNVVSKYYPIWRDPQKLTKVLLEITENFDISKIDVIGVTMTAELSDAYQTKRKGVNEILSCVKSAFPSILTFVLNTDVNLSPLKEAQSKPLSIAAANWAATGWLVAQFLDNAVIVDVGSTSTSIIPVIDGYVAAKAKTDLDKLICGELIYVGSLRTNVAMIVQALPVKNGLATVSSEHFALSGDVHRILGHIDEASYTTETADGRGKTIEESMARLARVVCADTEMLTNTEITKMAHYIHQQQVKQITKGLKKVLNYTQKKAKKKFPIVVTGLGKDFLARRAAQQLIPRNILDLDKLLPKQALLATPAVGVAAMALERFNGAKTQWI